MHAELLFKLSIDLQVEGADRLHAACAWEVGCHISPEVKDDEQQRMDNVARNKAS
jgi:hypothetical protein